MIVTMPHPIEHKIDFGENLCYQYIGGTRPCQEKIFAGRSPYRMVSIL